MPPVEAPVRIEIVDPATDLPLTGAAPVTAVADESPVRHPLERLEPVRRRLTAVSWWLARRRMQRISNGDPRRNSTVRRHLLAPFPTVLEHLPAPGSVVPAGSARLQLTAPFVAAPGGGVRAEARLGLLGSWPALPLQVTVEPWWRERTTVSIELRTTRRLRYPRRYFGAAHAALHGLIVDPGRPVATPP